MRRRRNSDDAPQPGAACRLQRHVRRSCCTTPAYAVCLSGCGFSPSVAAPRKRVGCGAAAAPGGGPGTAVKLPAAGTCDAACRRSGEGGVPLLRVCASHGRLAPLVGGDQERIVVVQPPVASVPEHAMVTVEVCVQYCSPICFFPRTRCIWQLVIEGLPIENAPPHELRPLGNSNLWFTALR
jgi:hypothetical protein